MQVIQTIMAIDQRLTQAVLRLRAPEMQPIVDYMESVSEKAQQVLASAQDVNTMLRAQGRYQAIQDVLKHFRDVEKLASK